MSVQKNDEVLAIMEYIKSTNLKGSVEIGETDFLWNLGEVFLRFAMDNIETTVFYSRRKSQFFEIGHFHEDNCNVIDLIKEINSEDKMVHVAVFLFGDSRFNIVHKSEKKKKSWLIVRHYYSLL